MSATTKQKKLESYSMERRPARQLRDFLSEDSSSSSSSTGFKSFPRRPPPSNNNMVIGGSSSPHSSNKSIFMSNTADPTMNNKLIKRNQITLQRSRSKSQAAADATMSAIHKLITYAVSTISISKSFSDKKKKKQKRKSTTSNATAHDHHHHHWELPTSAVKVCRVKDILRWKSFRDLVVVVDKQQPEAEIEDQCQLSLDHVSADLMTTKTNSTAPGSMYTSSCSSSSKGSSCGGDSEFSFTTSDELPCGWSGTRTGGHVVKKWVGSTVAVHHGGKKQSVGEDGQVMESMKETMEFEMGPTEEKEARINEDEEEQKSPVSVLDDSPFTNDQYHDNNSSFHHSIASLERTKSKLLQSLERFERLASGCNFDLDDVDHEYLPADDNYIIDFEEEEQEDEETKDIQDAPEAIRARELIRHIKSTHTCTSSNSIDDSCEHLLFDFFVQELNKKKSGGASNDHEFDMAIMEDEAISYITRGGGECCTPGDNTIKGGVVLQGHVINDMERETRWCVNKFEEDENEELVVVMEKSVLNDLVDELLVELF